MLISGCILTVNTLAQGTTVVDDSIFSHVLNEQRKIRILLPDEYKSVSGAKFDVVFCLTGNRISMIFHSYTTLPGKRNCCLH